jgi:hypothetical protein
MINPKLEGWAIVASNGLTLIGKHHEGSLGYLARLEPVFQFSTGIGEAPWRRGRPGSMYMVQRVFLLSSLKKLDIPENAIVIKMEDLSDEDRMDLGKWVQLEENFTKQLRASQSGLTLG